MHELASRYAQALYSLKRDSKKVEETQIEVKEIMKIIKDNPDFLTLLDTPHLSKEERIAIVDKVFASIDEDIKNLIKIVIENGRALYLLQIFEDFNSLANEYRGVKEGLVYSAMPISDKELSNITKTISEIEKCPVELKVIVDSTLIGGIKVVINDHIYDGSIKHHIEEMKNTLLKKEGD
ncbi:MAG: F0F1 ATP synthase subunit delta [Bacilli bacterium]|nr:F0F1 ATP synthase subunit delta [Bacilli bacterium]